MKNAITIIALTLFLQISNAQTDSTKKISPEEMKELKAMRKEMNLSPEQKAKLKAIREQRKSTQANRKTMTKEQRRAVNKSTKAQVDSVLTPDQEIKRDAIVKKRRAFRKN